MYYVKRHVVEDDVLVAVCDAELLDKVLVDEGRGIRFHVSPWFYQGELVSLEKALDELSRADMANIVGRRIVDAAIKEGLIHRDAVINIGTVPHAQFIVLKGE